MKLNRVNVAILNILFVVSPMTVAMIGISRMSGDEAQGAGMVAGLALFPISVIVAFVAVIITFFVRKSKDALRTSLIVFGAPSALLLIFVAVAYF